ncbi:MAG TPA: dihydrolipoamide acetyltransferase family protein, partial [Micrococcaceae bacterium]
MIKEFKLPDLGEGLTESEIVAWKVAVGDRVTLNQIIAEVETAKAVVELPSPYAGIIAKLHEQPGTVVEVGSPIVSFELEPDPASAGLGSPPVPSRTPTSQARPGAPTAGAPSRAPEAAPGTPPRLQPDPVAEPGETKRVPTLVGYGAEVEKGGRPARRARNLGPAVGSVETRTGDLDKLDQRSPAPAERPRSTPPVRKLARDLGVDLASVSGTGPHGLITREDVRSALTRSAGYGADGSASGLAPAAGSTGTQAGVAVVGRSAVERETRTPIKGVRKYTAAAMVASAFTAPHVSEFLTVDVTPTMELLARLKASRAFTGYKLTPLTLVAKALCIAVGRQPSVNSRWDEANAEIVTMNYVNLGIAAATPRGLMVPNIKDAQALTLTQLSTALTELTDTARSGKTQPAELSGGTISITNIGVFGIDAGTPILNPGEAMILAMGAVRRMPWEFHDEIALRQVMTLSISFDHRLVDGEQGSRFL